VFLTTHYLEEADALCDRVLVIDNGKIIASGAPEELKRRISGDVVTLSTSGDLAVAEKVLAAEQSVREIAVEGRALRLSVEHGEEALPSLLRTLDHAGLGLTSIQLARTTLDDVFLTLTGKSLREDAQATPDAPTGGDQPSAQPSVADQSGGEPSATAAAR
jgi:ABC-2 type transport system ATP-binding protein